MRRTAIIIEDDLLIAFELEDILHELDFTVGGTFVTENDAVAGAFSQKPDLLLVDYRLAQGDGASAVERIRLQQAARVVYVSASGEEVLRREPDAIHVDKPFDRNRIAAAIDRAFHDAG
ncbi:hypothetical protein GCM10007276_33990 [Agaricicola taiwanensis]|uniref:Response regulatory domain-containing protein n=1 Tax=Agaricicola taiwanensis TaxID=591372 RepID=A0A8J2YMY6_9RHOB|nr:response regulator [Agaricicola taiwanensis]GGE54117.1 hypothetical protein GCM10007276_33990 [Agaricicola taiwanensis]